jgi:hypothetical protein
MLDCASLVPPPLPKARTKQQILAFGKGGGLLNFILIKLIAFNKKVAVQGARCKYLSTLIKKQGLRGLEGEGLNLKQIIPLLPCAATIIRGLR